MVDNETKKIIFVIPAELHKEIKVLAARRNITMAYWIVRQLENGIIEERKYDSEINLQKVQKRI